MKTLTVIRDGHPLTVNATWEASEAVITPKMAKRAIRHLFGYIVKATVTDMTGEGYTIYTDKRNSHRRVSPPQTL